MAAPTFVRDQMKTLKEEDKWMMMAPLGTDDNNTHADAVLFNTDRRLDDNSSFLAAE